VDTADSGGSDVVDAALADLFGRDHEVIPAVKAALARWRRKRQLLKKAILLGLCYNTYLNRNPPRVAKETGIEWVKRTLCNETTCYSMFSMNPHVFDMLHDLLVH
jgi:hypothetical protein